MVCPDFLTVEEAARVLRADFREPIIHPPAQGAGNVKRLRFDPAKGAEEREHAGLHPLAIHAGEVRIHLIEG